MNIFLHHRDIRYQDNTTMIKQIKNEGNTIPIFIFDPIQINPKTNKYFSNNFVQFLIESLEEYQQELNKKNGEIYFFYGDTIEIIELIHKKFNINSIAFNFEYSPFGIKRDDNIKKFCLKNNIKCYIEEDILLYNILNNETLNPNNNKPYLVYTAFYNHLMNKLKVLNVDPFNKFVFHKNIELKKIIHSFHNLDKLYIDNPNINVHGGRSNALKILKNINDFKNYIKDRDILTYQTTQLSAYININVISIREVYYTIINKFNKHHGIIRELIFRDFYYNALYRFPYIIKSNFYSKYDNIKWDNDKKLFKLWCEGKTGYPIIDAGMKQLNTTGYMHNRMRMVVASFLIKNLLIDWRWGEKYFASKLIDYNISANNGGWSNISGSGISAQAWYRVFNPSRQNKIYDPDCQYIKKWIPELKDVSPKDIINNNLDGHYYKQCIDFEDSRDRYFKTMKTALK